MIEIYKKSLGGNLERVNSISRDAWINVISPTKEEMEELKVKLKVPDDFIANAMDDDEKSRCEAEGKSKLFIFRVPTLEDNKVVTHPLSIIINPSTITTMHLKRLEVLLPFYDNKIRGFSTTKRTRFLLQILLRINKHFLKLLDKIEKDIDEAEKSLPHSLKNEEILKLLSVQRTLTYFSTAVVSNHSVLDAIMNGKMIELFEEDMDLLEDIMIENNQCMDMISLYGKILNNMLNASASITSNNLNAVMKVLASMTIVMSVPTIIASIYGMNVQLPLQQNALAFPITIFLSLFLMLSMVTVFVRKRWL